MRRIFFLILIMCMVGTSCANDNIEVSNGIEQISNSRETRPPAPTGRYAEGEENALYEQVCFRVESELLKYVNYEATDKKNIQKNIIFLLEHYKELELDVLDSAEYITEESGKYEDDIDNKIHDKIYTFWIENEAVMNELTGQAKMGHGHITEYHKTPSPAN